MFSSSRYAPYLLAILRIVAGIILIQHGLQKEIGVLGGAGGNPGQSSWDAHNTLMGCVGILETGGSILLFLGLLTRPIAFVLSGEMAVAYWWRHFPRGTWPVVNRGEPAVLLCFIFLFLAAAGAGAWSIDRMIARRRGETTEA
jgi:putative oxidoreductase